MTIDLAPHTALFGRLGLSTTSPNQGVYDGTGAGAATFRHTLNAARAAAMVRWTSSRDASCTEASTEPEAGLIESMMGPEAFPNPLQNFQIRVSAPHTP
jgi:hypothetical protein